MSTLKLADYDAQDIIALCEEGMDGDGRDAGELFHLIETTLVRYDKSLVTYAEDLRDSKPWDQSKKIEVVTS